MYVNEKRIFREQLSEYVTGMVTFFTQAPGFAQASVIQRDEDSGGWKFKVESGGC